MVVWGSAIPIFLSCFEETPFLEMEEARNTAESIEMSTMRAYMKELIAQNEELTKRIHALETGFPVPQVDLPFSTPNGSEPPKFPRMLQDPRKL